MAFKRLHIAFALILAGLCSACIQSSTQHDINIASFTFRSSDTAPDIENISFAVDTTAFTISNSDSLAFSSRLTKVVPVIQCYSTPSAIRINGVDWNQTDTLDLSSQPVIITIVGSDKVTSCDYTLTINQHKVDPDSIIWVNRGNPFDEADATDAYALKVGSKFYALVAKSSGGAVYVSDNGSSWSKEADYSDGIDIRSANCFYPNQYDSSNGRLFAVNTASNSLMEWKDGAWSAVKAAPEGYSYADVLGSAANQLIVLAKNGSAIYLDIMDASGAWIAQPLEIHGLPLSGAAKITISNFPYLIGGQDVNGSNLGTVYSSDNATYWTNLLTSATGFGFGERYGAAVFQVDAKLFLLGGSASNGVDGAMYVSADNGYSWNAAENKRLLPAAYGVRSGASALVSSDENIWLIGGTSDGSLSLDLWQGRINKSDFLIR